MLLSEAEAGKSYAVSGIHERDRKLLEFLEARGIRPGGKIGLVERNYDKTLSIRTAQWPNGSRPFRRRENLGFPFALPFRIINHS